MARMIRSRDNEKLKLVRKLHERRWRDKLGLFFVEGEDLVKAGLDRGFEQVELLIAGENVEPALLAEVSTLAHPPRVIGVFRKRESSECAAVALALWQVADPGNVGTLVRSADALRDVFRPEFLNRIDEIVEFEPLTREQLGEIVELQLRRLRERLGERGLGLEVTDEAKELVAEAGWDPTYGARPLKRALQRMVENPLALRLLEGEFGEGVMLSEGCADPFGPKALRAAMGSTFGVPFPDFDLRDAVALVAEGGEPLEALDLGRYSTIVLGSEREGLPDELLERCEARATIPVESVESLNVAMAGTIALYERAVRSRRSRRRR